MKNKETKLNTANRKKIDSTNYLLIITISLFAVMYIVGLFVYNKAGFGKPQTFFNMLIDNAALLVCASGMTIVMITGGIDISVGSMVALVCMTLSYSMEYMNMPAGVAIALVLIFGLIFGAFQGWCVSYMELQPFIVTLAGLFFCRGLTAVISSNQIAITKNKWFLAVAKKDLIVPFMDTINKRGVRMHTIVHPSVIIAIITIIIIWYMLKYTRFGRNLYAIGGSEQSALLMGINVKRTKFFAYVVEGFLSSLAGLLWCLNTTAGFVEQAKGFEMEAISSAVIGGTMLTGGVGTVVGTFFGVLIKATIETIIRCQGTLSSWWNKIVLSAILCFFIILQSVLSMMKRKE
ncbi:MAG: sugar ABC transporter permease YjfF [Treponema sp.]|nr:sugar ABC transporter permease YjfF [Spirochaetia bacterium]MDY2838941.1 sugar ABC transporter permease YjfF [Treponema sp.]MDY5122985.1 sugar ABC transporter permease YjfF [Treponema sp.]